MTARRRPTAVRPTRRGMTLVELLVVTGLLAMLLGLTVIGVRGGRQEQKRTAEDLASLLAAAQGRALGVPEGAAVILDPGGRTFCTNGCDAEMLPLIAATVSGSFTAGTTSATLTVSPANCDDVQRAYRILLAGLDAAAAAPPTAWFQFVAPGTISFRADYGQTENNTIWPRLPPNGAYSAVLAQYPVKSSAVAEFAPSTAVDLRFSGVGDDLSTTYGRLADKGAIAVVFDRVGRVAEIILQVPLPGEGVSAGAVQPLVPSSTIYFLIAERQDVEANNNTLASAESLWVALAPQTGRVFVAENVPQTAMDNSALRAARAKARQGITVGK